MKTLYLEQGTEEWAAARAGLATASEFSSILAKGQGKTRAAYLRRIVAERLTGLPTETFKSGAMERGQLLEPDARILYEEVTGSMVHQVGLILHDDLMVGGSPDGLVDDDGGLEIKSVLPSTQVETILGGKMPTEHIPQVQGNLWVSGRRWWDFVSYCPEMPRNLRIFIVRVPRDAAYIATLESEVRLFLDDVDATVARLSAFGLSPNPTTPKGEAVPPPPASKAEALERPPLGAHGADLGAGEEVLPL